jgi:serine protease AprX
MLLAFAPTAMAAPGHRRDGGKARPDAPNSQAQRGKLDHELTNRSNYTPGGTTKVIVTLQPGQDLPAFLKRLAIQQHGRLNLLNAIVLTVPNRVLNLLASNPAVAQIDYDRPIKKSNYRTSLTTGARAVQRGYGLTGAGVGVAIIDSGIASWHDDLTARGNDTANYPYGNQRVAAFVDFVNGQIQPYDDDGHGTHVAGIIAGNGFDSRGQKAGVAPDASLVSLKVLDGSGNGTISNIISAFDWILANHAQYNIRVVNISVGAPIHESYWTDPLTLAAKAVVDAGVIVVAAAGNAGKNANGQIQYGGIAAPGNSPWVITVGASSTQGTDTRSDDIVSSFSSRGPTFKDWGAKPDLVAPGTGTISLAAPNSNFYNTRTPYLVGGSFPTPYLPYLSLSGTSMAAPVVTGTVALMVQANPNLTPNLAKAILQYTAQQYSGYDPLTEGAGFLNTLGAVRLARFFATAQPGQPVPTQSIWSKQIIWGTHLLSHGFIHPEANAFAVGTDWGAAKDDNAENIVWGTACADDTCDNIVWGTDDSVDNIVWGTACADDTCDNIVWGTADGDENIVWGTDCGGDDCENVVWGTVDTDDNIVWGTADSDDNIVWGTACDSSSCDDENIVWGTDDSDDNIVWGTADSDDNIVWGTDDSDDNIVWGTDDSDDNIVWGTASGDGSIAWSSSVFGNVSTTNWFWLLQRLSDAQVFNILGTLGTPQPPPSPPLPPTPPQAPPTGMPTGGSI